MDDEYYYYNNKITHINYRNYLKGRKDYENI